MSMTSVDAGLAPGTAGASKADRGRVWVIGLIVVIAATFFVRQEIRKSYPPEDTFSDPKMAFEETKKALMMISKGFGKGQREASKINLFNDAGEKVQGKQEKKKKEGNSI